MLYKLLPEVSEQFGIDRTQYLLMFYTNNGSHWTRYDVSIFSVLTVQYCTRAIMACDTPTTKRNWCQSGEIFQRNVQVSDTPTTKVVSIGENETVGSNVLSFPPKKTMSSPHKKRTKHQIIKRRHFDQKQTSMSIYPHQLLLVPEKFTNKTNGHFL